MQDSEFEGLERAISDGDPAAGLHYLVERFQQEKNYAAVFQVRLAEARLRLGLPLIAMADMASLPPAQREPYEEASLAAAREVGQAFLTDGDIARAWPYFRAIGETAAVEAALESAHADGPDAETLIGIAFQEGIHPAKGLQWILDKYGMCRAITAFARFTVQKDRQACITLLVRSLHAEVARRISETIADQEGAAPACADLPGLMEGRDWLFGEYSYYTDMSHLGSVIQYALEAADPEALQLIRELCLYGQRLSNQFQQPGYPPFEQPFVDYEKLAAAMLGMDVDGAVAHFREKVDGYEIAEVGFGPAQQLVIVLIRLERFSDALEVFRRYLADVPPQDLACPTEAQICQMAGDYAALKRVARENGDLLAYAAALIGGKHTANGR